MSVWAAVELIAPGAAMVALLALILTMRPDPMRITDIRPEKPARDPDRSRRRRRHRPEIEI